MSFDPMFDENPSNETVGVYFDEVKRETDKAILFVFDEKEVWLPKSQIVETQFDANSVVWIPRWLAEKNELDYE